MSIELEVGIQFSTRREFFSEPPLSPDLFWVRQVTYPMCIVGFFPGGQSDLGTPQSFQFSAEVCKEEVEACHRSPLCIHYVQAAWNSGAAELQVPIYRCVIV
jgi:hypothetical protein